MYLYRKWQYPQMLKMYLFLYLLQTRSRYGPKVSRLSHDNVPREAHDNPDHPALSNKHAVRRWRTCNPNVSVSNNDEALKRLRSLLAMAHNASSISDANFEVVESPDAVSSSSTTAYTSNPLISAFYC